MSEMPAVGTQWWCAFEMSQGRNRGRECAPEAELMRAVVLTAIRDLESSGLKKREALAYIQSREEEHVFSFNAICRYFGFDPEKARWRILSKKKIRTRRRNW